MSPCLVPSASKPRGITDARETSDGQVLAKGSPVDSEDQHFGLESQLEWKSYVTRAGSASRSFPAKTEENSVSHCFRIVCSP